MAIYIDYNNNSEKILYDLLHSSDDIPENDYLLFDYFRFLHLFRHNLFHSLILKMLGQLWAEEKPLSEYFDILSDEYGRKTPDIVIKIQGIWYFIDVSISVDIAKTAEQKNSKYQPIVDFLNQKLFNVIFIHLNLDNFYNNISTELHKIEKIKIKEFDMKTFERVASILEDKKEIVHNKINKENFEILKKEYFAKKIPTQKDKENQSEVLFRDELKYEVIGNFSELDIEQSEFDKYNSAFTTEKRINDTITFFPKEEILIDYFKEILETENLIKSKYADKKLENEQFNYATEAVYKKNKTYKEREPKPTHHFLIPLPDDIEPLNNNNNEQEQLLLFMEEFTKNYKFFQLEEKTKKLNFLNDIFEEQLSCLDLNSKEYERNSSVFWKNDEYKNNKHDYEIFLLELKFYSLVKGKNKINNKLLAKLNVDFTKENTKEVNVLFESLHSKFEKIKQNESISFREYQQLYKGFKIEKDHSYVYKSKMIKIPVSKMSYDTNVTFKKSGIKADYEKINIQERKTISIDNHQSVDKFINYLAQNTIYDYKFKEEDFLTNTEHLGGDNFKTVEMKKEMMNNYIPMYMSLKKTNAYCYSHFLRLFYKQLMHYVQYNTPTGTFTFFNCGLSNCIIVLAGAFNNSVHDYGKPFMCLIKTKNPDLYDNFFGKIKKTKKVGDFFYVYTNWRRLSLSKVTFMCDVFSSTLSSTMNTMLSSSQVSNYFLNKKIEKIFALRTIIGYSTNQKIAELLMDTRYAYMSSLSVYTNIGQLLKEKFGPPFSTTLEVWIINRLFTRLMLINSTAKKDGILQTKVEMSHNVRDVNTIGGKIKLPSLWFDHNMFDVTELMDEAFIYVHTMKEPSNIFHENVKAIKTIISFQKEYDSLPDWVKYGEMRSKEDLSNFLLMDTKIGCSSGIIHNSTKYTISKEKPFFKKIIAKLNEENICELLSTKAVIADNDRQIVQDEKPKQRDLKKKLKRKKIQYGDDHSTTNENMLFYFLQSETKYYNKMKPRQKVMETILDKIEYYPNLNKTIDLANFFIKKEKKVIADICIKAQYGAKREFYVVNIGAKAIARITELFFKELCLNSPNEAISIPGDEKIISMQSMLDRIYFNPLTKKHKLMYVNGDCTKWSAAETMTSFISMAIGLKENITPNMYRVLLATFNSWSDKEIQVPMDIFNKVVPNKNFNTDFLKDEHVVRTGKIHSTQNFLQGMFNYSSSYKAVCCNNYTYYIWKRIYPSSNLIIEHMEHSDDYVLIVLYEDILEFEKFRTLQKIMMRLHGYNDSERKTSCQPYLMEFVSQLSFNGVMLYPQIKKSKEINLSLPCTGYVTDMEAAISRVGECSRVGCNLSFLYFFQRLHCYVVADAYSILPGMTNNFNRSFKTLLDTPIELFGIPDVSPLFSLYCKGNGNNYRIYNFVNKKLIYFLYDNAVQISLEENFMSENIEYKFSLKRPNFLYEVFNKTISNLRKSINIENEQIRQFWANHIAYKFLKPKDRENLIVWIKCMFYNKTFLEAYAKTSRSMMTMRLSKFVKTKIIKDIIRIEDYNTNIHKVRQGAITMEQYYHKTIKDFDEYLYIETKEKNTQISKIITKCDPTYSAIYSIVDSINIISVRAEKERTIQIATKTPVKLKTINIQNEPSILIQYLYNKDDFIKDKRVLISKEALEKDVEEIKRKIPNHFLENNSPMNILSVYNDLTINKNKKIIMFGFTRHITTLPESILEMLSYNFLPGHILNVTFNKIIDIIDPFTGSIIYSKGNRLTPDYYRQSCENICLFYVYLKYYCNFNDENTKEVLSNIVFSIKNVKGEEEIFDYQSVLRKLDNFYINNFNYNLEDKKIIGFLRASLLGEYDVIDEIVSSIYSFTYKYILKDNLVGNRYLGETLLQFTYFNTTCRAYYNEKTIKEPLLIVQKQYDSIMNVLYNVAIKMTIGLSDLEFESTINKNRMSEITLESLNNYNLFFQNNDIVAVVLKKDDHTEVLKIDKLKKDTKFYPIFITKTPFKRGGDIGFGLKLARPRISDEYLSTYLGQSKLYTLPFWRCKQHPNIRIKNKDIVIENIYLSELCKNSLVEKFLKDEIDRYTTVQKKVPLSKEENRYFMKKVLMKYKIYDLDWSKQTPTQNPFLEEILKTTPQIKPIYERKFLVEKQIEKIPITTMTHELIFLKKNIVNNNENKEEVSIDELLKKNATEYQFDNDFLMEDEDEDFTPTIIDDINDDLPEVKPQYIGKEIFNIQMANIPFSDIFVEKPKTKRTYKQKEGVNYMLTKLYNQKPLYLKIMLNDYGVPLQPNYITIMNICIELKIVTKYLDQEALLNEKELSCLLIRLYKLLCDTFIIEGNSEIQYCHDKKELKLIRCLPGFNFNDEQIQKLSVAKKLYMITNTDVLIHIDYSYALKTYQNEITENKTKKTEIMLGFELDKIYTQLLQKQLKKIEVKFFDELFF